MRITRRLLPLSLLIASCAPAARPPVASHSLAPVPHKIAPSASPVAKPQPAPVIQKTEPPAPAPDEPTVTQYTSLASAAESVMMTRPPILAFGEAHQLQYSDFVSTAQHFARQIMPLMPKYDYRDLVIELIPKSKDASKEIEVYNTTGKLGPILETFTSWHFDRCGIAEIIIQARELGITIHGAHAPTLTEYLKEDEDGTLAQMITKRLVEEATNIRKQGKPVIVYSGAKHNNKAGDMSFSVMVDPPSSEFDIFTAEQVDTEEKRNTVDLVNPPKRFIPYQGVSLIGFSNGKKAAILPESDDPIIYSNPSSLPPCPTPPK